MSAIPRDQVEGIYALSPVQHGIFLHTLLDPGQAYIEQTIWRLQGAVDPGLAERAWSELVARHATLRTVFRQARRQPVQIVVKPRPVTIARHDWTSQPSDAQRRSLTGLARHERAPFELADGPLFRLALARLGPDEWRLVWTFHHIILDSLSVALLLQSFAAIYDALAGGGPLPEPEAPPFSQYVAWLARQDQEEALRFWATHLDGFVTPATIPADRLPASGSERTQRACAVRVGQDTVRALGDLARARGVTVATLLQAAWGLLLARYSGEPDVVFGLTLAGRPSDLDGVERIAGPFINTVPMRVSLAGDPRLDDLLRALHEQRFDLEQHGHVSMADVQGRTAIRPPAALFETALNVHPRIDWRGFRAKSFALGVGQEAGSLTERTNYDLMVDVGFLDTMTITATYAEAVYDRATIEALLANLQTLVGSIAACDPGARVSSLNLLAPDGRARVLDGFNRTAPPVSFDGGVMSRIEAQAEARPAATAVIAGGTRLTYGTLNARANRIASWLRAAGVGREDRVAVFGERGAGWLTFVLGVLKAGAAFVPLDPMQPDARLAAIVAASGVRVLACGPESASRALALAPSAARPPAVVCWDAAPAGAAFGDAAAWAEMSDANPPRATGPRDLACVFFTSGSTGAPKGVMVEHAGILNHMAAKISFIGIDSSSVVAQNASIGFDISVWQMFSALTVGGTVAIYEDEVAFDQPRLVAAAARDGVTVLETVPSLMDALIDAVAAIRPPSLAVLVSNAEFLPVPLCRRWLERFPHIPLMNTYGPTECSDDNAHYWQREAPPEDTIRIPVGGTIPGGRLYVVDRAWQPVPIGAPGEMALGGIPVGRGYLDDPVKTALAFVPDPFSPEPGARMYLSGDLGRWTNAGVIEWLRRDGDQVKVRGHRIELGEIQAALLRHPGVRQAVAVVRSGANGEPRILAYWAGDGGVDASALRDALAAALPRYMLPSAIVRLDAFPVTSNGKLDRRALPAPPDDSPEAAHVPPSGPIETGIAAIWREVLGVERVGATDNFYELGGQSLRTMQIRSRIVQQFGVDVPLRAIFRNQTVRDQARVVAEALDALKPPAAAIPRLPDAAAYALSHAQRRLWVLHQLDPADTSYNLIAPLSIDGDLDAGAFERAWSGLVARQAGLRTVFEKVGGEPVQRILPAAGHGVTRADLSALPEQERARERDRLLAEARNTPFTLETPPVRALLLTLAPDRHLFVLALHHLVSDGWSGDVLLRDLLELYRAARDGGEPRLPPMPIRYVDYAAWQHERFAEGGFAGSEAYWMAQLSGELPRLDLPAPRAAAAAPGPDGHTVTFSIDRETAERLRHVTVGPDSTTPGAGRDVTPFMLQLSLLEAWLARLTGADDLLVGSPVAGRDRPETEPLVGFFVNLLPLRTSLAGDPSFAEVVDRVKRSSLDAYAHQDYPFDELVRRLKPARQAGHEGTKATGHEGTKTLGHEGTKIFDVLFLTGRVGPPQTANGLTIAVMPEARDLMAMRFPGVPVALFAACIEQPDGSLWWTLTFDAARVDRRFAEYAAARFETLARRVAARPRARLSSLDASELRPRRQEDARPRRHEDARPRRHEDAGPRRHEDARPRRHEDPPRRHEEPDGYPLSLAQRDVWRQSRLGGDGPVGTLAMRVAIDGPLDEDAFVGAVRSAANGHEACRLGFGVRDGVAFQRLAPAVDLAVLLSDLTLLDPAEQEDRVRAVEDVLARAGFDLATPPLVRAVLLRLAPDRRVLVLAWHRLIIDGWHIDGLLASIAGAYERRLRGDEDAAAANPEQRTRNSEPRTENSEPRTENPELRTENQEPNLEQEPGTRNQEPGTLRLSPPKAASWQAARLDAGHLSRQAGYWRRALERASAGGRLPRDRSPNGERTFAASTLVVPVPPDTVRALRAVAKTRRTTTLRVVASAFAVLAARLAGERGVALAVPMAARPRGLDDGVGSFVHDVPVVLSVAGHRPFETLVAEVTDHLSRAHDAREYAAACVAPNPEPRTTNPEPRTANPEPGTANSERRTANLEPRTQNPAQNPEQEPGTRNQEPGTAIAVALTRARRLDRACGGARMRAEPPVCAASPYDLTLAIVEGGGSLELRVTYAQECFDRTTIARWSEYLAAGLARAAARPEERIDGIGVLPDRERERLVRGVNATTTTYPPTSVHRVFEARAAAQPQSRALAGRGREWSYDALNRDANRLARRLVALGAGPGAIVATLLDRSPDFIIALLAILKAGAAYLPLDSDEAAERLTLMLEDAGARLVVTTAALAARLPPLGMVRPLVLLDRDAAAIAAQGDGDLPWDGGGESLGYVMYTSGSTGRPKGVMIPHRGIIRLVCQTNWATLGPDDCVAHMGKVSFDACTIEIFGALLNGGTLVPIAHETMLSPAALEAAFDAHGVTVAFATPSFFQQVVREAPRCFRRLKTLLVGGDVMSPAVARRVQALGAPGRLVNVYGPTENSSVTTAHLVDAAEAELPVIPIGRPISNTTVYIVNAELQPAGVGMPGELLTGGDGLADGYLGRPDLTAETFVPDPFSGVPGARLYRTGDVASWRADGVIDFRGRADHQVKVRGHRIEPGEIEAVLTRHETVAEAVVVARQAGAGDKQLAAYVTPRPDAAIDPGALRQYLSARLPGYMVPTWIVPLASLPLGRTGKPDRKALPDPEGGRAFGRAGYVAPRPGVEAEIARVWREILGVEQVGAHDDFFDLGGDSLHCIVAVARLTDRGIRTTPKAFYESPTVAGIAASAAQAPAPAAEDVPLAGPMPLVPVQRSFFEQDLPSAHHWNVGRLLRAERLDEGAVERALQAILDHHDALRARFWREGGQWRQRAEPAGERVCFEVIDLGRDVARLTRECERIQASLDLTRGPIFRAALFRLADGTDRLLVIEHHLVSDIASGRTIVDDLARAYEQAVRGDAVDLGPRTTSYRRWAEILEAEAPRRMEELPYWQSVVGPGWEPLPLDHDLGGNTIDSIAHIRVEMGAPETRALVTARQTLGMDLYDVLLAALARTLGGWTGAREAVVLIHNHGREQIAPGVDLSRTVGWFTAMYPLRLETGRGAGWAEHLHRTREIIRNVPARGLGYGLLREMLRRPELLSRPYPDVTFNYRGQVVQAASESRFGLAGEPSGALIAGYGRRSGLLNLDCVAVRGRLNAVFVYSRHKHRPETIDALAQRFAAELRDVVGSCAQPLEGAAAGGRASTLEQAAAGVEV